MDMVVCACVCMHGHVSGFTVHGLPRVCGGLASPESSAGLAPYLGEVEVGKGGGGGHCGQGASNPIAEKLRCRNQTSQSLKEQHFGTGDTQGNSKHARWTSKKQLRKIAKNRENLRTLTPPPPPG